MQTDSDSRRRLWPHTHPARAAGMAVDGAMYVAADVQLIVGVEYRAAIDISARPYAYLVAFGGRCKAGSRLRPEPAELVLPSPVRRRRTQAPGAIGPATHGSVTAAALARFVWGALWLGGWSGPGTFVWWHTSTRLNLPDKSALAATPGIR
jgi:hypothetical protein